MAEDIRAADSNLLKCCLCKDSLREPRTLSCLHLFCLKCLEAYASSKQVGDHVGCPVCHSSFTIPEKGLRELPKNCFVQKLLKAELSVGVLQNGTTEICDSCLEETNSDNGHAVKTDVAKWYCLPCKKNLCPQCRIRHTNSEPGVTHDLIESSTQHKRKFIASLPSSCSTHEDEEIRVYCRDCGVAICERCYIEQHCGHTRSDVEVVAEEFRQRIEQDLHMVMTQLEMGQDRMRTLEMHRKRLEDLDDIERIINQKSEELKALVDNDTNRLLMSLEEAKKRAMDVSSDQLQMELQGEGSSESNVLEGLETGVNDALFPTNLTFTASPIGADDQNLIGRLVVVETTENLSDDVTEKMKEINADLGHHDKGSDADGDLGACST